VTKRVLLAAVVGVAGITHLGETSGEAQSAKTLIPYADAKPIIERLRASLPADLAAIPESQLAPSWNSWVSQLDRRIRARLERGDEDSTINFLLFGTSFTKLPRALNDSAKIGGRERAAEIVRDRIADLTTAIASPDKRTAALCPRPGSSTRHRSRHRGGTRTGARLLSHPHDAHRWRA
jgi:hypothetical protein